MFTPNTSAPLSRLLFEIADGRTAYPLPTDAQALAPSSDAPPPAADLVSSLLREEAAVVSVREKLLRFELSTRVFDYDNPPPRPLAVIKLWGKTASTAGNITLVQGPMKSGKSGLLEALLAAAFDGNRQDVDTLGFSSENPKRGAVIHLDTEQSRFDSDALIRRALRRARVESPPAWFSSHCVTDLDIAGRRAALELLLRDAKEAHGGVHLVIVDGVADLCLDPNDAAEAFELVAALQSSAIAFDCPFVLVIHENPGSETGKTRGHLGSQLGRKAETPIRLHKDETSGITTVWADRARHLHVTRGQGTCFHWSDAAGMHVACGTAREIKASAKRSKFEDEAGRAFGDDDRLTYTELRDRIIETAGIAKKTAESRVASYAAEGLIVKGDDGKHTFTPGLPLTLKLPLKDPSRV